LSFALFHTSLAAAGGRQVSAVFMFFLTFMSVMFMLLAIDQTRHTKPAAPRPDK
jgi:hypothetical protein